MAHFAGMLFRWAALPRCGFLHRRLVGPGCCLSLPPRPSTLAHPAATRLLAPSLEIPPHVQQLDPDCGQQVHQAADRPGCRVCSRHCALGAAYAGCHVLSSPRVPSSAAACCACSVTCMLVLCCQGPCTPARVVFAGSPLNTQQAIPTLASSKMQRCGVTAIRRASNHSVHVSPTGQVSNPARLASCHCGRRQVCLTRAPAVSVATVPLLLRLFVVFAA